VGRTARAGAAGDAFLFVSPQEEGDLRAIERVIGRRLPRVTLPGFDYTKKPAEKLEVPLAQRLAAMRQRRTHPRHGPPGRAHGHGQGHGHSRRGNPRRGR
jgi:ATP-dependent RNA helicase RhlE